jgi:hypothetical protein
MIPASIDRDHFKLPLWGSSFMFRPSPHAVGRHETAWNGGKLAQNGGKLTRVVDNFALARVAGLDTGQG